MKKQYIEFAIQHQSIKRTDNFHVVGGSQRYLHARFTFCDDWNGEDAYAIFSGGGQSYRRHIVDGECEVPWEVLLVKRFFVGCEAGDKITTDAAKVDVQPCGAPDAIPGREPSPTLQRMIGNLKDLKTEEKRNLVAAINEVLSKGGADEAEIQRIVEECLKDITEDIGTVHDETVAASGAEMTELWAEVAELREIVRDWPTLKVRNTWKGSISASQVTAVNFVDSYEATGTEEETWNADLGGEGKITGYRTGTEITISANGSGKIRLNPTNSLSLFGNMSALKTITGLDMIDASMVENLAGAFYGCAALKEIDLSSWHLQRMKNASGMFNGCTALRWVKFSRYGIPNLETNTSMFDGCTTLEEVDMGRGLPTVGNRMFFKCLELVTASGLDSVSAIGDRAFVYTPKLAAVDLRAKHIASIGESACRLSGIEDSVDLAAVTDLGDMATRHKRWSEETLAEIRKRKIPTVYIPVPNAENQDNYADIQFGTYNGEAVSVAEAGCSSLALYHEWNAVHAGTDKEYASYRDWWNATIGATDFVAGNTMDDTTIPKMLEILGWTSLGLSFVEGPIQLETIIQRLSEGLPVFASMHSANNVGGTHAVLIIGGDADTRKLAVLDSHVIGTTATVSWLAFEDIFVEGSEEYDYIEPFAYE